MSDLSDFKRLVYEPEIKQLRDALEAQTQVTDQIAAKSQEHLNERDRLAEATRNLIDCVGTGNVYLAIQNAESALAGGGHEEPEEPSGSTAVDNPERIFPWLGDSEPCPSREEQAYERLLEAGWGIYNQLVAIANITADFNSNSMMHATDFWREVTGGQAAREDESWATGVG